MSPDLAHTLAVSLRTSVRLTSKRNTPANRVFLARAEALAERLDEPLDEPLTPEDLEVLRRSLTSTQALLEMGGRAEEPLARTHVEQALLTVHRWSGRGVRSAPVA